MPPRRARRARFRRGNAACLGRLVERPNELQEPGDHRRAPPCRHPPEDVESQILLQRLEATGRGPSRRREGHTLGAGVARITQSLDQSVLLHPAQIARESARADAEPDGQRAVAKRPLAPQRVQSCRLRGRDAAAGRHVVPLGRREAPEQGAYALLQPAGLGAVSRLPGTREGGAVGARDHGYGSCRTAAASAGTGPAAGAPTAASNQARLERQTWQTDSMTGTSTRTPTTVASAAPEPGP